MTTFRTEAVAAPERLRRGWRRHRFWIIVVAVSLAVAVGGYVLSVAGTRSGRPLAADNPAPAGGQAAATVLANQGVRVIPADSLTATVRALEDAPHGSSTVLFYDPLHLLAGDQVTALGDAARRAGARIVAIEPGPLAVRRLDSRFGSGGVLPATAGSPGTLPAGCANADAVAAGGISPAAAPGGAANAASALVYHGPVTCFSGVMASTGGGRVTVLGAAAVVDNGHLDVAGNAALAFRLLGGTPNLLWYIASPADIPASDQKPDLAALTPGWILPAALWLMGAALVGMLWRGRRLGPLVEEPLPVIVAASETVTGRARLYQDAKAVGLAGRTLQTATRGRLARYLRLGSGADAGAVATAVAASLAGHGTVPHARLVELLVTAVPRTEKELLALAQELDALEEEVVTR
ncbi:DUF4350 domain-containing protein [Specibacter cremeus]|uniref:DUF4350 domain-containing protein n=1 Tax=Specibacter cremeus TaxID=1629051 RepID=UPI0013DDDB4B|nr:DUF4350 domain-containing protein [Specibacter cremeus]